MEMALDAAWDIVRIPRQPQSPKMRAKLTNDKVNKVRSRTCSPPKQCKTWSRD